jgi:hypothetical protein
MTKKSYAMNFAIILGISVVLMLFIFVLVAHHHDVPDRIRQHHSALPAKGGNQALSNAEVKAAVDYLVAQSK